MKRSDIINGLTSLFDAPRYLEIGVAEGDTFLAVKSQLKVGVDPSFLFNINESMNRDKKIKLYEVTSDYYFGKVINQEEKFDVIFIDGLHTFEQTLRDFCNAVFCLSPEGIIVVDDVLPSSYPASLSDPSLAVKLRSHLNPGDRDMAWMGDTYRLVFFVEAFFQQFSYATVLDASPQLIAWRRVRLETDIVHRSVEQVARTPFEAIVSMRESYRIKPYVDVLRELQNRSFVA